MRPHLELLRPGIGLWISWLPWLPWPALLLQCTLVYQSCTLQCRSLHPTPYTLHPGSAIWTKGHFVSFLLILRKLLASHDTPRHLALPGVWGPYPTLLTMPCYGMSCLVIPYHAKPCHAMPCHTLPCHALLNAPLLATPPDHDVRTSTQS